MAYEKHVWEYVLRMVLKKAGAYGRCSLDREELTSIITLAVAKAWESWQPERGVKRSTFLIEVAWREYLRHLEWINHTKRQGDRDAVSLDAAITSTQGRDPILRGERIVASEVLDSWSAQYGLRQMIHPALEHLTPDQATVIYAHYFRGMGLAEIAEELGSTRQNIYILKTRALEKMRKVLQADHARSQRLEG